MRVFDFTHAIVREPGRSVVGGLRTTPSAPSYEGVVTEHRAYVAALREAGVTVDLLPPLGRFPQFRFRRRSGDGRAQKRDSAASRCAVAA